METRRILSLAIDLELKTSECYERIGKMAGAGAYADDLAKLAKEEIVHANLLRSGKDMESSDTEAFGPVFVPAEMIEEHLAAANAFLEEIDAGRLTFPEAVRRVRDLEIAFERVHMTALLEIRDPRLRRLFRALSAQDAAHQLRLQSILRDLES